MICFTDLRKQNFVHILVEFSKDAADPKWYTCCKSNDVTIIARIIVLWSNQLVTTERFFRSSGQEEFYKDGDFCKVQRKQLVL